jgi:hypothetical protein
MGEVIRINETKIAMKEKLRKQINGKLQSIRCAGQDK